MKTCIAILFVLFTIQSLNAQEMRPLEDLINTEEPGWELVEEWLKDANNSVQILPADVEKADSALYYTQVTTRSPMGAIVHGSGGILVDNGWLRILGSGSEIMPRSLPEWNKGKSFEDYGQGMPFLLIADDVIGGFFALNGGWFGREDLGMIYYLAPDSLEWEALGITYSQFIYWAFMNDLDEFYKGLRWKNWKEEIKDLSGDRAISFFPFLWARYDDFESLSRKDVPVEEIWLLHMDFQKQILGK